MRDSRPLSVLVCAMGGEGGGVLTSWIVEAARAAGLAVQATSVPGVAQRTGGTTYYIEMAARDIAGRSPVFALTPVPGQIDVVLASELAEGARAAVLGFATPDRTSVIASTHRVFLIQEKMAMGDGRMDPAQLQTAAHARALRATFLDMEAIAQQAGVPISPVMLGALAGASALPIPRTFFEDAIRASGIAVAKNLAAFDAAFKRVSNADDADRDSANVASTQSSAPGDYIIAGIEPGPIGYPALPPATREIIARATERLSDYQDDTYAELYRKRLEPFINRAELLPELARQLALRMTYEDVIRVAQHKARAARYERIQAELGVAHGEPFEVQDYFKPGMRELADILPSWLARTVLRRVEARGRLGNLHIGMKVKTTTISGYLRVWMLARLRRFRRGTHRYAVEQAAIEQWLGLVQRAAERGDVTLAREIVELARLIKGYGDTHVRGSTNFARIVDGIVEPALHNRDATNYAALVRRAREAALADPEGKSLDAVLSASRDGGHPSAP